MLRVRISSWRACSVNASVSYANAEGTQNEHLKNRKTDAHDEHARKKLKILKNSYRKMVTKASQKIFLSNSKQILLKIRLRILVRNFAAQNKPLNIEEIFNPKFALLETLWCNNHENQSDGKSHTWAPLNILFEKHWENSTYRKKIITPQGSYQSRRVGPQRGLNSCPSDQVSGTIIKELASRLQVWVSSSCW